MHIQKTVKSETEVVLAISATIQDLEPIQNEVRNKLAKNVKVAGFRSGKVPPQIAEKHLDQSTYQAEFLDEAMTQLFAKATEQEQIRPVTQPKVEIKKFVPFSTLEFDVISEVFGPVKLGNYKGLKSSVKSKVVTEADVEGVLVTLQTRMSERKAVTRAAKQNDEVIMDFKGVDAKGEAISGADGKDYPLILGSNAFIPGFEDNLVGLKTGEEKTFTLTFPKDYGVKALASKKVTFSVIVKTVNELNKPKVDDEFAKKAGPFKTLDELRADIKKQLEQEAANDFMRAQQNELVEKIVNDSEVAVPESVVDQQVKHELDDFRQNLMYRGQTFQEYLEMEGKSEEQFIEDTVKPKARLQVKTGAILSEIAAAEQLDVTLEELEMQLQLLKNQYKDPQMQAELDKPEARRDIASRILTQKVINLIVDQSVA